MIIYYYEYARTLLEREEQQIFKLGYIKDKLFKNICKIFEWDTELNLIC